MERLIQFRLLADSLSQNEFYSFIKKSNLDTIRNIIFKGLFSLFHTQIQNDTNSCSDDATETINIISNIIQSRNSKQVKEIESKKETTQLSLNDLPCPLIGECASYLPFIDYHSLQNVSRVVFIGCNNPNTITTIDWKIFERNFLSKQHLKLRKYQKVINFEIPMRYFLEMKSIHNLSLSPNTKSLLLYCDNLNEMKKFLNVKCLNFDNIEILKLYSDDDELGINTFCDVLKRFKNIKFLQLYESDIDGLNVIFDDEQFRNKIFNNLQGLSLDYFDQNLNFYNNLLHYFGDKLLSLHLWIYLILTPPKNGFINLKELCICYANYDAINAIIKTAKKLERVHLAFDRDNIENENKLEEILMELFNQNTLEYISIKINKDIQPIKNALKKISFSKRKRLKIMLEVAGEIENANEYFEILENKFSEDGVIDDWMIIFVFPFIESMRKYFPQNVQHNIGDKVRLVKTNKTCKINGWRERWLYYCDECR